MAHYFKFSRDFDGIHRLCGECRRTYDDGDHIEITKLKPYTHYVCPSGGGYGHSSIWTGAYLPSLRTTHDHLCACGAEFVKEDIERWVLSWEMQTDDRGWRPVSVTRSRHAAHEQRDGLLELIEQGEQIRNIQLEEEIR